MKRIVIHNILLFCILFAGFFLGFYFHKRFGGKILSPKIETTSQEKFFPVIENKPIVVVIAAYNVEPWCEQNLKSVFDQNYLNFRVIYVDDHSTDSSFKKVQDFVEKNHLQSHITLIRNEKHLGPAANYYKAIHLCEDHEIVVCLEGDDWLSHEEVLAKINSTYADPGIWLTYSDYLDYPSYRSGISGVFNEEEIARKGYRGHKWVCAQLKTFYAGLFKKVKLKDFFYQGDFLNFRWDWPVTFAMLEMAHEHIKFIPEVLLIHNRNNPLNNDKLDIAEHIRIGNYSRALPTYQPLAHTPYHPKEMDRPAADLVIFSLDRCMQLHACLESIQKYVRGMNNIYVIYVSTNEKYDEGYDKLKQMFPSIFFIRQPAPVDETFKSTFLQFLFDENENHSQYVVFGVDSSILKDYVDMHLVVDMMETTNAYAFFLCLGNIELQKRLPPIYSLANNTYTWQFHHGEGVWNWPHNLDMTVYRKKDIKELLYQLEYNNPNDLRKYWGLKETPSVRDMALCFKNSKVLHMSGYQNQIFITPMEFQEKYLEGYKINIAPLHQMQNDFYHVDHEVDFVKR